MSKLIFLFILSFPLYASILGDVRDSHIYPGYITFDQNDKFYTGHNNSLVGLTPIEKKTPSQIIHSYFDKDYLSAKKIETLIIETKAYLTSLKKSLCIDKFRKEISSYNNCDDTFYNSNKFKKKWKKNKFQLALNFVIEQLNELKISAYKVNKENINSKESQQLIEKLFTSLEIIQGIRGEDLQKGKRSNLMQFFAQAKSILSKDSINKNDSHPSNLLKNSDQQMFYSYKELSLLTEQSVDISKFDPPDSGIWRRPKKSISEYNTSNYNNEGRVQLEKIFKNKFIDEFLDVNKVIKLEYRGDKLGGGKTIKFDVYIKDVKFKIKFITNKHQSTDSLSEGDLIFKHIQASEANVEPVANTLAASIGYTVDPTYFKKRVRLYLPEKIFGKESFERERLKLISLLTERYGSFSNAKSALSNVQIDNKGKKYLLIHSVSLEQKSNLKTDVNIGFFQRSGMGKSLKREHRGLYSFLALIMDIDLKDDNSKVKIVPYTKENGQLSYKVMLSNSDMGSSLGTGHPNLYNFNLVRNIKDNKIDINFIRLFSFDNRFSANLSDAKWMTRRIAQLSLKQITNAFRYAGFTDLVAQYYALLFAKKRNQLVVALGLNNETFKDDAGKTFTINLLEEFSGTIKNYEEFFSNGFLTDPQNKLLDKDLEAFPRFWGLSYTNFASGDPQQELIQKLKRMLKLRAKTIVNRSLISRISLSNRGFGYLSRGVFERNIFNYCSGKCFISGLNIGVSSFVPFRFIVNNPNTDSEKPFLLIDIFRLGYYAGNSKDGLERKIGSKLINTLNIEAGINLFKMKEYIKIKEVDSINDFFAKRPKITVSAKDFFKSIEKKIIALQESESIYLREYLGFAGEIITRPNSIIPFSSLRLRAQAIGLKSNFLQKKDGHLLLRRGLGTSQNFDASFNLVDMILRLPLLRFSTTKKKLSEDVIKFSKDVNRSFVLKCMKTSKNCTENQIQTRNSMQHASNSLFNFFWMFRESRVKTKGFEEFKDIFKNKQSKEKYYIFKVNSSEMRKFVQSKKEIKSIAHIDKDKNINISIQANDFEPAATRKHLNLLFEKYNHLLPDDILNYDTSRTKYYLGDLSSKIDITIKPQALEELFDDSFLENSFCESFLEFNGMEQDSNCLSSKNSKLKVFIRKYKKAKDAFWKLKNVDIEHARYRNLKVLAKFFYDKKVKLNITKYILRIIPPKYFKRDVSIISSLSGFPGDIDEIKESKYFKGKASQFNLVKQRLIGDKVIDLIAPFFYNNIDMRDI